MRPMNNARTLRVQPCKTWVKLSPRAEGQGEGMNVTSRRFRIGPRSDPGQQCESGQGEHHGQQEIGRVAQMRCPPTTEGTGQGAGEAEDRREQRILSRRPALVAYVHQEGE